MQAVAPVPIWTRPIVPLAYGARLSSAVATAPAYAPAPVYAAPAPVYAAPVYAAPYPYYYPAPYYYSPGFYGPSFVFSYHGGGHYYHH